MRLEAAAICVCNVCGRRNPGPSPLMALDQYCCFLAFMKVMMSNCEMMMMMFIVTLSARE